MLKKQSVTEWLQNVNYEEDINYIPSDFALEFITFIKLVNGEDGVENKSPVLHYKMLDQIGGTKSKICNLLFRGSAKTTTIEYLILYIAVYGSIPDFDEVSLAMYIADSIENGIKNMRKNLEYRWDNSDFLKYYVPETRFTDIRWEFTNRNGKKLIIKGYGQATGIRGVKEMGQRPNLALIDDILSDEDARSPTVISSIEDTIYKAITYALHPKRNKIIWSGTPHNARDPLYKAVESGAWHVNVYPVCETFPCTREEFSGAWEDRFSYDVVNDLYQTAMATGKIAAFTQEMMLNIMSEEDKLLQACDYNWYKRKTVLDNKGMFNFYITTDFATSEKTSADLSILSVWAYNSVGDWLWVDGVCKRQLMDKNVNDLFRLAQLYKPQEVGIEVSGQQGGFIPWIQNEMLVRNIYFNLASDKNGGAPGIRPVTNKMERFLVVLPWFKLNKFYWPEERKESVEMVECITELQLASVQGFKSKNDDFIDNISQLSCLKPWKPSQEEDVLTYNSNNDIWELDLPEEIDNLASYIV